MLKKLLNNLPEDVYVQRVLGGLAKDTDAPMPIEMQNMLQGTWRKIEEKIPDIHFNFDFWTECQPRRATYNACRAVIVARSQGKEFDEAMTAAIQTAYYQQARNPSDLTTLIELAKELGLDKAQFEKAMSSQQVQQQLEKEIQQSRELYAESFPSLVLQVGKTTSHIPIDYLNVSSMLETINRSIQ